VCGKYRFTVDILVVLRERLKRGWKNGDFDVKGAETRENKRGNKLHFCFSDGPNSIRGRGWK
jgi:hypothetical protein